MKQVALLSIEMPDYFTGYHLPVLTVPLTGTITHADLADLMESEFNAFYDYINPDNDKKIYKLYKDYIKNLRKFGQDIFYQCDEVGDDVECECAHFSIINPVTKYGIKFLNP